MSTKYRMAREKHNNMNIFSQVLIPEVTMGISCHDLKRCHINKASVVFLNLESQSWLG